MVRSQYLSSLTQSQRSDLIKKLWNAQKEKCFICEEPVDLKLHEDELDVDHVIPLVSEGKDNESNFALTHFSCNRSKGASDLRIARILKKFDKLKAKCAKEDRIPNLNDILKSNEGTKYEMNFRVDNGQIKYSFPETGDNTIYSVPMLHDELSNDNYFVAKFPIEYLFHDDRINPRPIGGSLVGLIKEFFSKRPQLHMSLGWIKLEDGKKSKVSIFDGQHKATAQVLLGVKELPVRVFVNPDLQTLLTANRNAGTTLRQVAFDKSVQRHLGSTEYKDRVKKYQTDLSLPADNYSFSEKELVQHFKGQTREMKKDILDAQRDNISQDPENKLKNFIEFGGRGKDKPLSYSTIEKTFYSFFIYGDLLETPIDYLLEQSENPRQIEKQQIIELMNIIAKVIFIDKFDTNIGTTRIEHNLQKGKVTIPEDHLIAYRLSKEEVMYTWLQYLRQIVQNYFITVGTPFNEKKLFQYIFPQPLWNNLTMFVKNFSSIPLWINKELSESVFGGKQSPGFWQTIFETGNSPSGQQVLPTPINIMEMIKD